MDFSEFYKQKEIDGLKSLVSRSRFMSEETKQFLMDILDNGKDQVMEAAKGKVKEDDEDEDEDEDEDDEDEDGEESMESKKKSVKEGELPPALAKAIAKKKNGNGDDDKEDDDEDEDEEPKESKKKTEAKKVTKEEFYDEVRDDMELGSYQLKDDKGKVVDEIELTEIFTSEKGKIGKFVRS